tara:strand:+ start:4269 stop:4889 length:621 start_codon:yes stop_codon:yes gene_type:complete
MVETEKKESEIEENKKTLKENQVEESSASEKELSIEEKLKVSEEKLLRNLAEMENQRRRFEKERQEAFEFGGFNFARESLSLLDNIERAILSFKNDDAFKDNKNLNKIIDGIEVIEKDLVSIFKKNGIETIKCLNKKFDPNFHQAMLEIEDNSKESGIVVQEIQKGYMMKDRLLRPSLVGVTKKGQEKAQKILDEEKKTNKKEEKK